MGPMVSPKELQEQVARRRTFAIISHPDAGKTTLTEKLLLYGGAIHLAGAVKAKSSQRNTTSDWMEIERQRGISISTSVLQFEYGGKKINLLDTPGHKDFSEDTYRTLVAVDAAVMLIDAAKGVEPQTRKLFEVCRMRGLPIFTFINKMDRPSREPLDLIDELENVLGIRSTPVSWPIGMGEQFKGIYDRRTEELLLFQRDGTANAKNRLAPVKISGVEDPNFADIVGGDVEEVKHLHKVMKDELDLLEIAGDPFDIEKVLKGQLTPIFFGSALNNFGVERFLETFLDMAPPPQGRDANDIEVLATDTDFSGMFFKIQANMDPQHRDRVSFFRVCSGKFTRGMDAKHARLDKDYKLSKSVQFFGQERVAMEEAWPGDIVGFLDTTGEFRIGDTLYAGKKIEFQGVPRFSPEHFATVASSDPLKRKQLKKGLEQLSEEGVIQIFHRPGQGDSQPILGAVGALQFEVLEHRIRDEYRVDMKLEKLGFVKARWVVSEGVDLDEFNRTDSIYLVDRDNLPVVLFRTDWAISWAEQKYPKVKFLTTAPVVRKTKK
jgi:peptide chain release factor 3